MLSFSVWFPLLQYNMLYVVSKPGLALVYGNNLTSTSWVLPLGSIQKSWVLVIPASVSANKISLDKKLETNMLGFLLVALQCNSLHTDK